MFVVMSNAVILQFKLISDLVPNKQSITTQGSLMPVDLVIINITVSSPEFLNEG